MLETMGKHYVPALGQCYRFHPNRRVLEFDDQTEYTLREAIILAKGKAGDEVLRAVHLVKRIFDGVLITEKDETEFAWEEYERTSGSIVASGVEDGSIRQVQGKKRDSSYRHGCGVSNGKKSEDNCPDSVPLLLF